MFRKILCFIGYHSWIASYQDYIDEFGYVPLNFICSNAKCEYCGEKYKKEIKK